MTGALWLSLIQPANGRASTTSFATQSKEKGTPLSYSIQYVTVEILALGVIYEASKEMFQGHSLSRHVTLLVYLVPWITEIRKQFFHLIKLKTSSEKQPSHRHVEVPSQQQVTGWQ